VSALTIAEVADGGPSFHQSEGLRPCPLCRSRTGRRGVESPRYHRETLRLPMGAHCQPSNDDVSPWRHTRSGDRFKGRRACVA
jgi:hypothetical protein